MPHLAPPVHLQCPLEENIYLCIFCAIRTWSIFSICGFVLLFGAWNIFYFDYVVFGCVGVNSMVSCCWFMLLFVLNMWFWSMVLIIHVIMFLMHVIRFRYEVFEYDINSYRCWFEICVFLSMLVFIHVFLFKYEVFEYVVIYVVFGFRYEVFEEVVIHSCCFSSWIWVFWVCCYQFMLFFFLDIRFLSMLLLIHVVFLLAGTFLEFGQEVTRLEGKNTSQRIIVMKNRSVKGINSN